MGWVRGTCGRRRALAVLAASALALPGGYSAAATGSNAIPGPLCHGEDPVMSHPPPGPYEIGEASTQVLESEHDGEAIEVGVVRPAVAAGHRVPVIVVATPYLDHTLEEADLVSCAPRLVRNFVQHGYAVGFVSVRGTSGSGGCTDLFGPAERSDVDQAITWFGEQGWSNGRVGMIGLSYDGGTAWEAAAMGNPYLKTIVPMSGVNDPFDLLFRHGIYEVRSMGVINAAYYAYPFFPGDPLSRSAEHSAQAIACPAFAAATVAAAHSSATGERDPLGYWAERNSRPDVERSYRGSIFIARGLRDWNVAPGHDFPWVNELERNGIYVKYMLGQWGHHYPDSSSEDEVMDEGEPVRWDWAGVLLAWWDRWLKGDETVRMGPRAQVQDSSGAWRNEKTWPPKDAVATDFFLTAERTLNPQPGQEGAEYTIAADGGFVGPPNNSACVCARFTMATGDDTFRFAGIPKLSATVIPSGPGGYVSAFLVAGSEIVGWGAVDLRFAHGGETARPVVPGQEMKVELPFEPLDVAIEPRKTLTLVVSQSGYGGGSGAVSITRRGSVSAFPFRLIVDETARLTLHTFQRGPRPFFTPPVTNGG